jgi:hypothetical protein
MHLFKLFLASSVITAGAFAAPVDEASKAPQLVDRQTCVDPSLAVGFELQACLLGITPEGTIKLTVVSHSKARCSTKPRKTSRMTPQMTPVLRNAALVLTQLSTPRSSRGKSTGLTSLSRLATVNTSARHRAAKPILESTSSTTHLETPSLRAFGVWV